MYILYLTKRALLVALILVGVIFVGSNSKQETPKMAGPTAQDLINGKVTTTTVPNPINQQNIDSGGIVLDNPPQSNGGGNTQVIDPQLQALLGSYGQSINNTQSAIDRLPGQQNSGNQAIDTSYTNALNQLLLGENQARGTYQDNKHQTGVDYVGAKNTIGANAGSSLSGLLRLLGSRGAGGSSAATLAGAGTARGAVGTVATQQRNDVTNTFGANNRALDNNWGNYEVGVNNQRSSAGNQRDQSKQSLDQSINTNRATLLQQLASLSGQKAAAAGGDPNAASQPYLDQANQILDQTANYSTPPISYQTQAYTAPDLSQYTTNPNAAPTFQGQSAGNDYYSPYLAALLGKKQQVA